MFHFPAAEGVSDTDGEADGVLVELASVEIDAVQDGEAGDAEDGFYLACEGGGNLVQSSFMDRSPWLLYLELARVGSLVGTVVLCVGQHQFIGMLAEKLSAEAQVMRLHAIVLYAAVYSGRGPGLLVHPSRQEQRVANYPSVMSPAGSVIGVGEVVIDAYRGYSRRRNGIAFVIEDLAVYRSRLVQRILVFIQDVANPSVLVSETE